MPSTVPRFGPKPAGSFVQKSKTYDLRDNMASAQYLWAMLTVGHSVRRRGLFHLTDINEDIGKLCTIPEYTNTQYLSKPRVNCYAV